MIRDLISRPLQQTIVFLWLLTLLHIVNRVNTDELSFSLVVATALAGLLTLFLESRYQLLSFIYFPILLTMTAYLVLLKLIGLSTNVLAFSSVLFVILIWLFSQYTIHHPLYLRLHDILRLNINNNNAIGTDRIIRITHGTLFFIACCALSIQLFNSALFNGSTDHSVITLLSLMLSMWILWSSRKLYPYQFYSYLMLLLAILSVMECLSLTIYPFNFKTLNYDRFTGLLFVSISSAMWIQATLLKPKVTVKQPTPEHNLYYRPLLITATLLTVSACLLQVIQLIEIANSLITPLDISVVFIAGTVLLLCNHRLKLSFINVIALLMLLIAIMWLFYSQFHPGIAFSIWPEQRIFTDFWLILGVLSLLISFLSLYLERSASVFKGYCQSMNTVAIGSYLWTLLGAMQLFLSHPYAENILIPFIWVLLIAGQFFTIKTLPYVSHIRGSGLVVLIYITLVTSLAALQLISDIRLMTALLAFGFLLFAENKLPQFNHRFPQWTVSPAVWPWAGLLLIYACLLVGGPDWSHEWFWLMLVVLYQLLMRKPYLNLPSILFTVLALLWFQTDLLHPEQSFSLWFGQSAPADLWLTLAIAALLLSSLSQLRFSERMIVYRQSLIQASLICYLWSLTSCVVLFIVNAANEPINGWTFLTLFTGLFSISKNWFNGYRLRGIGGGCLLTLTVIAWLLPSMFPVKIALIFWGYILWWLGWYVIPLFNKKQPNHAFEPKFWPWLGLAIIASSGFAVESFGGIKTASYFLALSGYCLLMHRYCNRVVLSWITALSFSITGLALSSTFLAEIELSSTNKVLIRLFTAFSTGTLIWQNLQLILIRFWNHNRTNLAGQLGWQKEDLASAFMFFVDIVLYAWLLFFTYSIFVLYHTIPPAIISQIGPHAVITGLLLSLSFAHILTLSCRPLRLHGLIMSCFSLAWGIYFTFPVSFLNPPLYLSLCSAILLAVFYLCSSTQYVHKKLVIESLNGWIKFSLIITSAALFIYQEYSLKEFLLNLGIVMAITAFWGLWTIRSKWFAMACFEFFIFLHCWPFIWLSFNNLVSLFPWFALQAAILAMLFQRLIKPPSSSASVNAANDRRIAISRLILNYWPWLVAVSLVELSVHILLFFDWLKTSDHPLWLLPPFDAMAILVTGIIICHIGLNYVKKALDSRWIYALVGLTSVLITYLRLIILGIAPLGQWDTAIIIIFAYFLFLLQRFFTSKPLLNTALLMPVFALFTVPLQLNSPQASLTLLITGIFYLLIRRDTKRQLPVYLALLAFNTGLYLWVPGFVQHSHLIQIYVIPVALSVLVLLQLHRRELKPKVLMTTRLASLCTIYAVATLDVFLLPDVKIFILAMLMSLSGILLGISLRVRAYLYSGVCFLLLNVGGQFIRFYPEQMLFKAIILMTMGMVITGAMIWFNIKRAEILLQIKNLQHEIQAWE